jgi:hypothetical protein
MKKVGCKNFSVYTNNGAIIETNCNVYVIVNTTNLDITLDQQFVIKSGTSYSPPPVCNPYKYLDNHTMTYSGSITSGQVQISRINLPD